MTMYPEEVNDFMKYASGYRSRWIKLLTEIRKKLPDYEPKDDKDLVETYMATVKK